MFALASLHNTPFMFFPDMARGHGSRKLSSCSERACQLMKNTRGMFSKEHKTGQLANYDRWLEEREFGERVK